MLFSRPILVVLQSQADADPVHDRHDLLEDRVGLGLPRPIVLQRREGLIATVATGRLSTDGPDAVGPEFPCLQHRLLEAGQIVVGVVG